MIVVTGASKGLGAAICERLLATGQNVLGLSRNVDGIDFNAMSCDVSDYEQVKAVARTLKKQKADLTAIVNVAGIASMNLAVTTPPGTTQKLIQTNLVGTINCCQIFAPFLLRKKAGSIINFSTIAVPLGLKGESVYAASKAGVEGFSRAFAREMADFNVRVNCIAPGPIDTDLIKGVRPDQINDIVALQIIPKQFEKSDVCDLVDFLLSDQSSSLSGQVLNVGGV